LPPACKNLKPKALRAADIVVKYNITYFIRAVCVFRINILETEYLLNNTYMYTYINSIPTSQEIHYISTTKINRLILFGEIIVVYFENHNKKAKIRSVNRAQNFNMLKQVVCRL
jgi:hypothetical protein